MRMGISKRKGSWGRWVGRCISNYVSTPLWVHSWTTNQYLWGSCPIDGDNHCISLPCARTTSLPLLSSQRVVILSLFYLQVWFDALARRPWIFYRRIWFALEVRRWHFTSCKEETFCITRYGTSRYSLEHFEAIFCPIHSSMSILRETLEKWRNFLSLILVTSYQ